MLRDLVDLVVLDVAGTTLDIADAVPAALERAFGECGLSVSRSAISGVRGRSKREAIRVLVQREPLAGAETEALSARIFERFLEDLRDSLSTGIRPLPGAQDALEWLRGQGIARVLTTGFDRALTLPLLAQVGWDGLLDGVVCADDVTHGRPHPDLVHKAMSTVGCADPSRVVVVGDTTADLDTGHAAAAGVVVGVLTGAHDRGTLASHPHTVLLESIAELPAWLESWSQDPGQSMDRRR